MAMAMGKDDLRKGVEAVGGQECPEFAGKGETAGLNDGVGIATSLYQHRGDEIKVHSRTPTMGVEVACGKFDGLAEHHAQRDMGYLELGGYAEALADVVAVLHKAGCWQVWEPCLDKHLALGTAVENNRRGGLCLGYCHAFADGMDKGFFAEGFRDAAHTDDADAALDAKSGIERATCDGCAIGNREGNRKDLPRPLLEEGR